MPLGPWIFCVWLDAHVLNRWQVVTPAIGGHLFVREFSVDDLEVGRSGKCGRRLRMDTNSASSFEDAQGAYIKLLNSVSAILYDTGTLQSPAVAVGRSL